MSRRSHRSLRLGALALLAALAIWPRTRVTSRTAELGTGARARTTTHGIAAHPETVSAKLVSVPATAKLTAVEPDESELKN
jgi:hypothetical protein